MIKKNIIFLGLLFIYTALFAQEPFYKHPSVLGVHFSLNDFNHDILNNIKSMNAGLGLSYLKGVNNFLDWLISTDCFFADSSSHIFSRNNQKYLVVQSEYSLRLNLILHNKWIHPWFGLGSGLLYTHNQFSPLICLGPGIELKHQDVYFILGLKYTSSLSPYNINHLSYSIGVAGLIAQTKRKRKQILFDKIALINKDSDGDGIPDNLDKCASIPGDVKNKGCPTIDSITLKSIVLQNFKELDSLCYTRIQLKHNGTIQPIWEHHSEDSHPIYFNYKQEIQKEIGDIENHIFFKLGSAELQTSSFIFLNELAAILKNNISIKVRIEGHTDNTGTKNFNEILSRKRAEVVKLYLMKKGIMSNRLLAVGYGDLLPIGSNKNFNGRSKNRRVSFFIY